jgi:cold shock protein
VLPPCDHRTVARSKRAFGGRPKIVGVVQSFDENEGWGVISAPEVPGGCFAHYSALRMEGYRFLRSGQSVRFTFDEPGFLQDGYRYRAIDVWPSP